MLQVNQLNCSPIKPSYSQTFGNNREVLTATADWLEDFDKDNMSEADFARLGNVTEKMHDGPFKTFLTILGIGGAAFVGGKVGFNKVAKKVINNKTIQKNISVPVVKFVDNLLSAMKKALSDSKYNDVTVKGLKPFVVKNTLKFLNSVEKYAKEGSEVIAREAGKEISLLKDKLKTALPEEKESIKKAIKSYTERKKLAATENLIQKVSANTAGLGAGTIAVVEANKDKDGNGIADIGEHKVA